MKISITHFFVGSAVVQSAIEVVGLEVFEYFVYNRGARDSGDGRFRYIPLSADTTWVHRRPKSSNLLTPAWNSESKMSKFKYPCL